MDRSVRPELLDELPPDDPRAVHSRADLQRVNALMGNAGIIARAIVERRSSIVDRPASSVDRPSSIVELGGGDGTFLLELAKRVAPAIGAVHATLVDQQALVTSVTREAMAALSWHVDPVKADIFEWLGRRAPHAADVTIANLFLHHFDEVRLSALLRDASTQTQMFIACEPRRSRGALAAASLTRLIGCNGVTVHDARISVRAGFRDCELSALWPGGYEWALDERQAGRFTHGFVARRGERRG